MLTWIASHPAVMAGLGVAVCDFIFAVTPQLASNGILHLVYTFLVGQKAK